MPDKHTGISKDDVICVKCSADEAELGRHGYAVSSISMSYTADRLGSYADDVNELDKDVVRQIDEECKKLLRARPRIKHSE